MTLRLVILASGRGSNAKAILNAIQHHELDAEVCLLISNKPDAPVLEMAQEYGVKTQVIASKGLSRETHEDFLIKAIQPLNPDYIVLAGYMRLFTAKFVNTFNTNRQYRIINIHPSLLPCFKGAHAYHDAWDACVPESGISIHYVTEAMDEGPILSQNTFPRMPFDTFQSFQERGLALEHQLYPKVLQQLAIEKSSINNNFQQETTACLPV